MARVTATNRRGALRQHLDPAVAAEASLSGKRVNDLGHWVGKECVRPAKSPVPRPRRRLSSVVLRVRAILRGVRWCRVVVGLHFPDGQ